MGGNCPTVKPARDSRDGAAAITFNSEKERIQNRETEEEQTCTRAFRNPKALFHMPKRQRNTTRAQVFHAVDRVAFALRDGVAPEKTSIPMQCETGVAFQQHVERTAALIEMHNDIRQ